MIVFLKLSELGYLTLGIHVVFLLTFVILQTILYEIIQNELILFLFQVISVVGSNREINLIIKLYIK